MIDWPVGAIARALVPTNWKWVRAILEALKGTKIPVGDGHSILLSEEDRRPPPDNLPPSVPLDHDLVWPPNSGSRPRR